MVQVVLQYVGYRLVKITSASAQGQAVKPTFTKIYVQSKSQIAILDEPVAGLASLPDIDIQINSRARDERGQAESTGYSDGANGLVSRRRCIGSVRINAETVRDHLTIGGKWAS